MKDIKRELKKIKKECLNKVLTCIRLDMPSRANFWIRELMYTQDRLDALKK